MKLVFFLLILQFFLFFSCSSGQSSEKIISDEVSLKVLSQNREQELLWTRELESVRLLLDTKKNQVVADNIKLEPLVMTGTVSGKSPVYPYLDGFGSLDTTSISREMRAFLDETFKTLSLWQVQSLKMQENSIFSAVLFKYDVENLWQNQFGEKFPLVSEDMPLFSAKLYGEPFIDDTEVQIPVRLYAKRGYLDVMLYFTVLTPYKIDNIQIKAWERK